MTTNIVETLPWIDYGEVFKKLEERGRAEGEVKGKAEGKAELATEIMLRMLGRQESGENLSATIQMLKDLGISDEVIEAARRQKESQL